MIVQEEIESILPRAYCLKMKELLKEEYPLYIKSFLKCSWSGIRINTLKLSTQKGKEILPFLGKEIPWVKNGFYFDAKEQVSKHPFYYAGLYYIQEPSAMLPANVLPITPFDKVLDLCAAPGGKSTELAAKLKGTGVLVSNDISASRAKALLKNIELFGVRNAIVLSEAPEKLENFFPEYFDKILVDAPCSGEGMFRKDSSMIKNWELDKVKSYHNTQKEILNSAIKMLKPGGMLVYSTCTFSPEENEFSIQNLLENWKCLSVEEISFFDGFDCGRPEWIQNKNMELKKCCRLWPFKIQGEGHFVALIKKEENLNKTVCMKENIQMNQKKIPQEMKAFFDDITWDLKIEQCEEYNNKWYLLPEDLPDLKGLRVLRSGLFLGEMKKNRFEPSQALAMSLTKKDYKKSIDFSLKDSNVIKYLKGETLILQEDDEKKTGWQLICVEGYPLGWGKAEHGMLKNKYYAGWRWM